MILTITLTAIAALGVSVMVIAPLAWAIVTQRRDWPDTATDGGHRRPGPSPGPSPGSPRRRHGTARYKPVSGQA
jgi:hypothetical protein